MNFNQKLILNQYLLSFFGVENFEDLAKNIKDDIKNENIDEEGVSVFHNLLAVKVYNAKKLSPEKFLEYDNNIVRHTKELKKDIKWKYFQYLSLLFTELYLDLYFSKNDDFLSELNIFLENWNKKLQENSTKTEYKKEKIEPFTKEGLNKISYWNATGSGKTYLMHINIKQFVQYAKKYNKKINQIILITPNAGLTNQHLKEFEENGIEAEIFTGNSENTLFESTAVKILEITKLKQDQGEKTFSVESFGDDNVVLIDEGHRGSSGTEWKANRDALSANGFAFEYSATFGQSVNSGPAKYKKDLIQEYAKSIIFDYSYKYFKNDGFGKDYTILNLKEEPNEDLKFNYLVGALLSFYQQKKIFEDNPSKMKEYNIENPLMVFVGGSVNAVKKEKGVDVSDVTKILSFLEKFIAEKKEVINSIQKIIQSESGIQTVDSVDIFTNKFAYLSSLKISAETIYQEILQKIFLANMGKLHIDELKGLDGEIGLRIGENQYFGVINIGDTTNFLKLCTALNFSTDKKDFGESLFHQINKKNSHINILIGSKKFTEGWSSWRVSTMGLLNMGKSEGSQIIQLFGRGVRLKGKDFTLKRSAFYGKSLEPKFQYAERLNIFGLQANYMEEFRKYLDNEGVESGEMLDFILPVITDNRFKNKNLKVLKLQKGENYKKEKKLIFAFDENPYITKKVSIDLFVKAQVIGVSNTSEYSEDNKTLKIPEKNLAFMDIENIYQEIVQYKKERKFYNFIIKKEVINTFLQNSDWYEITAPKNYFSISQFSDFQKSEEIFLVLLKKYITAFYTYYRNNWEKDFMEYQELEETYKNFIKEYNLSLEQKDENLDLIEQIKNLEKDLKSGNVLENITLGNFKAIFTAKHLYNPLLSKSKKLKSLKISPIELNEGEIQFVEDLEKYFEENLETYKNSEIFLLRNNAKTGIGFFEEANFYPDFILWILKDNKQYITFIDPKGIRNLNPETDPKINFYKSIEKKEVKLKDENIILNSFIISNTKLSEIKNLQGKYLGPDFFEKKNVLFQENKERYIDDMINKILYF